MPSPTPQVSSVDLYVGQLAQRDLEVDIRSIRFWIVLSSSKLRSAAQIICVNQFRLQILCCLLQRPPRIILGVAHCRLAQSRFPRSKIVLKFRLQLRWRPIEEKFSEFSVSSQSDLKVHVHQFVNGIVVENWMNLRLKESVLLEEMLQQVCGVGHINGGIDATRRIVGDLQKT